MRRWLLPMIAFALPVAVAAAQLGWLPPLFGLPASAPNSPYDETYFPNSIVTDQNGKTYRFWDDVLKDQTVVVNFMFTGCAQVCPLTTARLAEVKEKIADGHSHVRFVSISLDPINDTPAALKKFADGFNIGSDWLFLTGAPEELAVIRDRLGERSKEKSLHQALLILANTKTGEWKKDSAMSEIEHLAHNVSDLDPAWRQRPQLVATNIDGKGLHSFDNITGQALFEKACSNCHTIGRGVKIGPDLAGVTKRRSADWLKRYIQRPDLMREMGDPLALELFAQYRQVAMPNLQLNETDAADVLSYIDRITQSALAPTDRSIKAD